MTAKLSPDSIGLIFTMNAAGHCAEEIADAAGCSYSTVVRYLNQAGVVLGNKGKPKQCTGEYLALALDMRAQGSTWYDVEQHVGFHRSTFHSQLRASAPNNNRPIGHSRLENYRGRSESYLSRSGLPEGRRWSRVVRRRRLASVRVWLFVGSVCAGK